MSDSSQFSETKAMAAYELLVRCQEALAEIKSQFHLDKPNALQEHTRSLHDRLVSRTLSLQNEYESAVASQSNRAVNDLARSLRSTHEDLELFPLVPSLAQAQVKRIRAKLKVAWAGDPECGKHGAKKHHYKMGSRFNPMKLHSMQLEFGRLPAGFRLFLAEVGSGPAGPGYGLYPLDRLSTDTLHAPHYTELDGVPALSISHVGCGAESMLAMAGTYTGCVYNSDRLFGTHSPLPSAPRFLDWYETWLDYVLA